MKIDPLASAARGTRCDVRRALVAACASGVESAAIGVLVGSSKSADEFADSQPDRGVAR